MNMVDLIHQHQPDLVINFGSCGNLKNNKVGEVMEVGTVYNNIDCRPFLKNMVVHQNHLIVKSNYLIVELIVSQQTKYMIIQEPIVKKYLEMINKCDLEMRFN